MLWTNLIIQIHLQRVQDFDQHQIAPLVELHFNESGRPNLQQPCKKCVYKVASIPLISCILASGNAKAYLSQDHPFDEGGEGNLQIHISTIIL